MHNEPDDDSHEISDEQDAANMAEISAILDAADGIPADLPEEAKQRARRTIYDQRRMAPCPQCAALVAALEQIADCANHEAVTAEYACWWIGIQARAASAGPAGDGERER